jgi:hypothetical protein
MESLHCDRDVSPHTMGGLPIHGVAPLPPQPTQAPLAAVVSPEASSGRGTPTTKLTTPDEFKAMRKHLELKEMDMGELVRSHGLSSALAAMDAAEVNPIVQDGELSSYCCRGHNLVTGLSLCRDRRVGHVGHSMGRHPACGGNCGRHTH